MSHDGRWRSPPVTLAFARSQRLRGLRPLAGNRALLVRARSVHGFGMRGDLTVVALDDAGVIRSVRRLRPRRVVVVAAATWILELPSHCEPPPPFAELRMLRRKLRP